jgi:hypothetical protein
MLGDDIAWALPQLRAQAESNMLDACTVTRVDPDAPAPVMGADGQYPETARITVYTGKCRIQVRTTAAANVSAGERIGTTQETEWQGPVTGTEDIAVDDVVLLTSSALDSALEGRTFTVAARHEKSQATARRLNLIEVTS